MMKSEKSNTIFTNLSALENNGNIKTDPNKIYRKKRAIPINFDGFLSTFLFFLFRCMGLRSSISILAVSIALNWAIFTPILV